MRVERDAGLGGKWLKRLGTDQPKTMKKSSYLAVYDYGMGGVWCLIAARSKDEIAKSYPMLTVVDSRPAWMTDEDFQRIAVSHSYDIDHPPGWLAVLALDPAHASDLIDCTRYPIADLESEGARRVVAEGRAQLARDGLCLLPGFVAGAALEAMAGEARALHPQAYYKEDWITGDNDGMERAYRMPRPSRNASAAIAYDMLAPGSPIRRLYEWDGLTALFKALLGVPSLYRCADPIISCLVIYFGEGDELGWHFDPNDGVVTLMLQEPEAGGEFEFAPRIRRKGPEGAAAIGRVIEGERAGVVAAPIRAGTLSLFQGVTSLHRVTKVQGRRPRIMLTMSYHESPGKQFSEQIRRRYSGRAA